MNDTIPLPEVLPDSGAMYETPHPVGRVRGLPMRVRTALALALCVAAVLARLFAPEGAGVLRRWIAGDGSERLQQAFFSMERALGEGEDLAEVWSAFRGELEDETA